MLYSDGSIEIPAKGDLPAIILAVTEVESSDPALRAFGFLTWNSLDVGLSFANLPAWLYVCTLRIQRLLMVRFAELLLLNRMCTYIQRLLVRAYRLSFQLSHWKQKPHSGSAGSDGLNENEAPSSEMLLHSRLCPESPSNNMQILELFGETHHIEPCEITSMPPIVPLKCNCAAIRLQAANIQNANSDEISIIHLASLVGWDNAEYIAGRFGFKSDRPLRALLEVKER